MKRFICCVILVIFCILSLTGCVGSVEESLRLEIVCTVFPQYDFIKNIAGDKVNVKMLVPLGTESHDFKLQNLTVSELKTVATADLIVYVGGESDEAWINELKTTVKSNARWCAITDFTPTLKEIISESMEHEHNHEHGENHHEGNAFDEHVWTSPKRAVEIVNALTGILSELDNKNSAIYTQNCKVYVSQLQSLDKSLKETVSQNKGKKLVFGDRFPFRYLFYDYGLDFDAAFPGCSAVSDPSVNQITSLTQTAVESGVKHVFYMENSNPVFAEVIAQKVGGKAVMLHSCHTLSRRELDDGLNYLKLMEQNIESIKEALNG